MNVEKAMAQAERTLRTAHLALDDGDCDSACNRAYYAMFYAARAALLALGQNDAAMAKTHSGLVASVGRYLIVPGHLPAELSSSLGRESKRRMAIDYLSDGATADDATEALGAATTFVAAIENWLASVGD